MKHMVATLSISLLLAFAVTGCCSGKADKDCDKDQACSVKKCDTADAKCPAFKCEKCKDKCTCEKCECGVKECKGCKGGC